MQNCDRTITLYNYTYDPETQYDVAHRHVLAGVSVHSVTKVNVDKSGMAAADQTTIRIPVSATREEYLRPMAYAEAPIVQGYFTLAHGDKIVLGLADEENPLPSVIEKKYGSEFCVTIIGVTDNRDKREPHWKVVCE